MDKIFVLYTALSVFGIGITIVDFLGILDHAGGGDHGDGADGDAAHGDTAHDHGDDGSDSLPGHHGHELTAEHHGSYLGPDHSGIRGVTIIMQLLRTAVYFSLGFGPTGLFAWFKKLPPARGLFWALGVGAAITVFAWLLRRFIRHDLDSSIASEEYLMETGPLLLPLEGDAISKMAVKRFGKEAELYVKSKNTDVKFPKGKIVRIVDYDNDVYWIEPAE